MSVKKFNPTKHGFVRNPEDKDEYFKIKGDKVIARLFYLNYFKGLPIEWMVERIVHKVDNTTSSHTIFEGRISDDEFAEKLFNNLIY